MPVGQWLKGPGAPIYVKTGTITVGNGSATGSDNFGRAVDPGQSLIMPCGFTANGNVIPSECWARLSMSATAITATRNTTSTIVLTVGYVLLAFPPGTFRTVQRGTVDLSAVTSATTALTPAVNLGRHHLVMSLGFTTTRATSADGEHFEVPRVSITAGGGSVTGEAGAAATTVAFQVAEWA